MSIFSILMLSYRNPMEHLYSPFLELKLFYTFCCDEVQVIIVPLVGDQPKALVRLWRVCEGPVSRIILTCVCKVEVSTCVVPEKRFISMIAGRFPFLQCRFKYSLPGASDGQPGWFFFQIIGKYFYLCLKNRRYSYWSLVESVLPLRRLVRCQLMAILTNRYQKDLQRWPGCFSSFFCLITSAFDIQIRQKRFLKTVLRILSI